MGNKVHVIYQNDASAANIIQELLYLGSVPNDSARDALGGLVTGNCVVVQNSAGNSGHPTFYMWNGSSWVIIGPTAVIDLANYYTKSQVDEFFASIGMYPPISNNAGLAGISNPNTGWTVVAQNSDSPVTWCYNGTTWVTISSASLASQVTTNAAAIASLNTRLTSVEYWQAPVAGLSALNAVSAPRTNEVRVVTNDGSGKPYAYRYTGSKWVRLYPIPSVSSVSDLTTFASVSTNVGAGNTIVLCLADYSLYYYSGSTWVKTGYMPSGAQVYQMIDPSTVATPSTGYIAVFADLNGYLSSKDSSGRVRTMLPQVQQDGVYRVVKGTGNTGTGAEEGDLRFYAKGLEEAIDKYTGGSWINVKG